MAIINEKEQMLKCTDSTVYQREMLSERSQKDLWSEKRALFSLLPPQGTVDILVHLQNPQLIEGKHLLVTSLFATHDKCKFHKS